MPDLQSVIKTAADIAEQFEIDPKDFLSAKSTGGGGTQIAQLTTSLVDAAQVLNRSFPQEDGHGGHTNIISPVVMPKDSRSIMWLFVTLFFGFVLLVTTAAATPLGLGYLAIPLWFLLFLYVALSIYRNSFVMIPDGCQALITKYGKVEEIVGPGRKWLIHPLKRVGYIVNVVKEYPYNAPIRQAPTQGRVEASVDLFLQFRIENPSDFIFVLGGAQGFSEKLYNAISEVTRALIYEQKAEDIYDLVGESTQSLLDSLNRQFSPAVRFVNANITHAEPASQEYRMDLAAPEIVRVAKEAYTYEYELSLRKEQDEGELNKDLASLRETLSEIKAEVATYQAQIDTAREQAVNRANAYARQLLIEAESGAKANAALLEAQALDIRALNSARYPEILEYRFLQESLNRIEAVSDKLPQVINIGPAGDNKVDFMAIARQMLGATGESLYSVEDLQAIRGKMSEIAGRVEERSQEIKTLRTEEKVLEIAGNIPQIDVNGGAQ